MHTEKVTKHIIQWLKEYATNAKVNGFVIGVSGGIDSAVTSTLCAETGFPVLCLEMPIHQGANQVTRAQEHIAQLKERYDTISSINIDLTSTFDEMKSMLPKSDDVAKVDLSLGNTRARLRMTTLYYCAGINGYLVCGTGNKVEDFGQEEAARCEDSSARKDEAASADGAVRAPDGWLCPVCLDGDAEAKAGRSGNRRASNKGYLPMGFEDYLRILDWTGRQVRSDKRGAIPPELRPILERLGVRGESWVDCVQNFGRWFHRAAGRVAHLAGAAARHMVSRREPLPASVRVTPPGHTKRDDPLKASLRLSASTSPFSTPAFPRFALSPLVAVENVLLLHVATTIALTVRQRTQRLGV